MPSRNCCGKIGYYDELAAKLALANAGAAHRSSARNERRVYRCAGGRWHLTAAPLARGTTRR